MDRNVLDKATILAPLLVGSNKYTDTALGEDVRLVDTLLAITVFTYDAPKLALLFAIKFVKLYTQNYYDTCYRT